MSAATIHPIDDRQAAYSATVRTSDSAGADALSVAVISPDPLRRNAAVNALDGCRNIRIREFISYPPGINDVATMLKQNFDVVIVDLDSDPAYALSLVEGICSDGPTTVMVFSANTSPGMVLRSMRAGAREFLPEPLSQSTMADALVRAVARRPLVNPNYMGDSTQLQKAKGRLLVFLGAKGGSGVTTLASNFAVSLAHESRKRTILIDLNLPLGDAALDLGLKAQYSTANALENVGRLDPHFLSSLLVRHDSGLFVLAAPSELAPSHVSDDATCRLLEVAQEDFDYVVVDAGSNLEFQRTYHFNECAIVYLVTQVGIPELRNSNRLVKHLSAEGCPKLEIVINRFDAGSMGIAEEHVTKALTRPADWKIPNDYAAVRRMQNSATSLAQEDSKISRAIQKMARTVCGQPALEQKKKVFRLF